MALGTAQDAAAELERMLEAAGPGTVAAFVAEPIVGATLAAAVPPDGYWPAIAAVCRRHGVLLIADEVMTGFGRTGRWFGLDHWGTRADILVAAKGATSGYWPFGLAAASGGIHETVATTGASSTASRIPITSWARPSPARCSASSSRSDLVEASAAKGERLRALLDERLGDHPNVGEIRGRGLLVGLELVADRRPVRRSRVRPGCRSRRRAARERGRPALLGHGQRERRGRRPVLLGPPFVITDEELQTLVATLGDALDAAIAEVTEIAIRPVG